MSPVPSSLPSSTTTSNAGYREAVSDDKHLPMLWASLRAGTTTLTKGVAAVPSPPSPRGGRTRRARNARRASHGSVSRSQGNMSEGVGDNAGLGPATIGR